MKLCILVYTLEIMAIGRNLSFDQIYSLIGVNSCSSVGVKFFIFRMSVPPLNFFFVLLREKNLLGLPAPSSFVACYLLKWPKIYPKSKRVYLKLKLFFANDLLIFAKECRFLINIGTFPIPEVFPPIIWCFADPCG